MDPRDRAPFGYTEERLEDNIPTMVDLAPPPPPAEAYPDETWEEITQVERQDLTW